MDAFGHAVWYALVQASIAFFCAEEPWAVSLPEPQSIFAALLDPPVGVELPELLSVPHAASASVAVSAAPTRKPCRFRFTRISPSRKRGYQLALKLRAAGCGVSGRS